MATILHLIEHFLSFVAVKLYITERVPSRQAVQPKTQLVPGSGFDDVAAAVGWFLQFPKDLSSQANEAPSTPESSARRQSLEVGVRCHDSITGPNGYPTLRGRQVAARANASSATPSH